MAKSYELVEVQATLDDIELMKSNKIYHELLDGVLVESTPATLLGRAPRYKVLIHKWVENAAAAYNKNGGYAGLTFLDYLIRMSEDGDDRT